MNDESRVSKPRLFRTALIVVLVILIGLAAATATPGGLGWFCPHTLEYRTQTEWTIFYGQVVIYRSERRLTEHPLVDFLVREGYVAPIATGECPRWHPMFHWNRSWRDGYSQLHRLFRSDDSLIDWTKQHPESARILWSEVFDLLRSSDPLDYEAAEYVLFFGWRTEWVAELRAEIENVKSGIRANAQHAERAGVRENRDR